MFSATVGQEHRAVLEVSDAGRGKETVSAFSRLLPPSLRHQTEACSTESLLGFLYVPYFSGATGFFQIEFGLTFRWTCVVSLVAGQIRAVGGTVS